MYGRGSYPGITFPKCVVSTSDRVMEIRRVYQANYTVLKYNTVREAFTRKKCEKKLTIIIPPPSKWSYFLNFAKGEEPLAN